MTLEQFRANWRRCVVWMEVKGSDQERPVPLALEFKWCTSEFQGGLIFLSRGGFSSPGAILRVDDKDHVYSRCGPGENDWIYWGRLRVIGDAPLREVDPTEEFLQWRPGVLVTDMAQLAELHDE